MRTIQVDRKVINNLRYADYTAIMADTEETYGNIVVTESEHEGLYRNSLFINTFTMVVSKAKAMPNCNTTVYGKPLK